MLSLSPLSADNNAQPGQTVHGRVVRRQDEAGFIEKEHVQCILYVLGQHTMKENHKLTGLIIVYYGIYYFYILTTFSLVRFRGKKVSR